MDRASSQDSKAILDRLHTAFYSSHFQLSVDLLMLSLYAGDQPHSNESDIHSHIFHPHPRHHYSFRDSTQKGDSRRTRLTGIRRHEARPYGKRQCQPSSKGEARHADQYPSCFKRALRSFSSSPTLHQNMSSLCERNPERKLSPTNLNEQTGLELAIECVPRS